MLRLGSLRWSPVQIPNKLPQMVSTLPDKGAQVQDNDDRAKKYADAKRRARPSQLKVGDTVLVRQRKQNKFCTRFDPVPFKVVRKRGTMMTASWNGKDITRNGSHFKVIDSWWSTSNKQDRPFLQRVHSYLVRMDSDICPVISISQYLAIRGLGNGTLLLCSNSSPLSWAKLV